ncbi:exosortase-associated protein EpsI, B-type [Massilia sp.]|uniref:exosortase-associated protein EpsI, B-type n=1 Tax=Massilia sp. TaxID=1882437 RepID=UPI00289C1243|nr:exosortase-associated protein EpsI, B-type [Massilia sp.]
MNRSLVVSLVIGVAMAATSALTGALTPQPRAPLPHELFNLEQMIPARFGEWTIDPNVVPLTPNSEQQGMLEKIYDQTLSRTYADAHGQRVMLSIAYGGDQSKSLQLHLPEVCYVAQGFQMVQEDDDVLPTRYAPVPVTRLVARLHERNEPITYWITIGDKATRTGIQQKLRRLAYGLSGEVPDGMLVRVSTVGNDPRAGWRVQDRFVSDMLAVLPPRDRARLIGADAQPDNHAGTNAGHSAEAAQAEEAKTSRAVTSARQAASSSPSVATAFLHR